MTRTAVEPRAALDVTAIRDVVFRPDGGGIYAGHGRWNGFAWPVASPPYLVARSELSVKLSDGNLTRVAVAPRVPGMDNVLFVGGDDLELLSTIVARLGGTRTREPTGVMEVPNQPIGPSLDMVGLWNEFFPSRPGHWGGWVFETYPIITLVEFTDPARNSARAEVTVGYAGATVLLRKVDGTWRAIGLVNEWVT